MFLQPNLELSSEDLVTLPQRWIAKSHLLYDTVIVISIIETRKDSLSKKNLQVIIKSTTLLKTVIKDINHQIKTNQFLIKTVYFLFLKVLIAI